MFYLSSLSKDIFIYPKDITSNVQENIAKRLRELEGKVMGDKGYIVSIVEFSKESSGKVNNETSTVSFKINYKAVTFKISNDEIMDVVPFFINNHGIFCKAGPIQIFVSQRSMIDWRFDPDENEWNLDKKVIKVGEPFRVKIIATTTQSEEISALGEIC